jgi:Spy/CpxP family protein refolding chaperone
MLLRRVTVIGAVTIALTQLALLSSLSVAQNPKSQGWLKDLNLTPRQVQQLRQIRHRSKRDIEQKKQAIYQAQHQLVNLMAGTASREQIQDTYNQIKALREELADEQFENTLAIREILTPEQRQKYVNQMYKQNR